MVYDPVAGYVLLFGGFKQNTNFGDTWTFHAGVWTKLVGKGAHPAARHGAMMVWDAADGYVLLFGGSNWTQYMNDTWKFQSGRWTELFPATSPPARRVAGVSYDSTDSEVVMFSGHSGTNVIPDGAKGYIGYNDTWTYRGGVWTEVNTSVTPAIRADSNMVDDPSLGGAVLFGGYGPADTNSFSDTWLFKNDTWTNLTPALLVSPSPRNAVGWARDPTTGADVLFGGLFFGGKHASNVNFNDTWDWQNGSWTPIPTSAAPPPRAGEGMVWDAADSYFVLFGGLESSRYLGDTWTFL